MAKMQPLRVRDLQKFLATCDPNATIVLARDAEGNRFSPALHVEHDPDYLGYDQYEAQFADETTPAKKQRKAAVILWPLH